MQLNPLIAVTPEELQVLIAHHMGYCADNPEAADWHKHQARAAELANQLPDAALEVQIGVYS